MLPPIALTPCLPTELLSYILDQTQPATLLICTTRSTFLSSLLKYVSTRPHKPDPQQTTSSSSSPTSLAAASVSADEAEVQTTNPSPSLHSLLIPTLQQLSRSRNVSLAFIPTVSHLRAYLSVFSTGQTPSRSSGAGAEATGPVTEVPLLMVYGLLEQHWGTSEWSTQGLGNSLAGLVEAGTRTGRRVVVVEGRGGEERWGHDRDGEREGDGDEGDEDEFGYREARVIGRGRESAALGGNIWYEKLPILNGSLRRAGADMEYAGRTVEVGVVLKRWFKFKRGDWDDG